MIVDVFRGILGIVLILAISVAFSRSRKHIPWRLVGVGILLQVLFAIFILKGDVLASYWSPLGWPKLAFSILSEGFVKLLDFTAEGSRFVFGALAVPPSNEGTLGYFFAFQTLTTIIFFSSLIAILYHAGIMQRIVKAIAWVMEKSLRISGAESLSNAANIFVGLAEAPLIIRPYLAKLTKSELFTVMVGGMATIAGGVMAAYVQMLGSAYSEIHGLTVSAGNALFAAHLLGASVLSAPAAIVIAKIMIPETETPETLGTVDTVIEKRSANLIDAATQGAADGLKLGLNIAAMIIALIALVAMFNFILMHFGDLTTINAWCMDVYGKPLSLQLIFGMLLQFIAYGIGFPWADAFHVGSLLGTKIALNEFVAYLDMSQMIRSGLLTSEKSIVMAAFALCGFSNFGSVAVIIGGMTPLAPNQRGNLTALGMRAMLAGMLATLLTATIAGILYSF
jgi:concentrative nucleoside transporter, CNT family